jgi:hypothetical protein
MPFPRHVTRVLKAAAAAGGHALVAHLVRSHWKALALAFLAVLGETLATSSRPWPIKIVVDNLLQGKKLPGAWAAFVFTSSEAIPTRS